jgi:hypothetical protein
VYYKGRAPYVCGLFCTEKVVMINFNEGYTPGLPCVSLLVIIDIIISLVLAFRAAYR